MVIKKRTFFVMWCLVWCVISQAWVRPFFSPQTNLTDLLVYAIEKEQKSIWIAMYYFTSTDILQALLQAKARGVQVRMIVDEYSLLSPGKGLALLKHGIDVAVYQGGRGSIFHHKFWLFESTGAFLQAGSMQGSQSLVILGSMNATMRAGNKNHENLNIIGQEPEVFAKYKSLFDELYTWIQSKVL